MAKNLPARPNLDHLRRQAKSLLVALEAGDAEAISTILQHLPTANGMSAAEVKQRRFRLADAQLAIARKTGFACWPHLAHHVDNLRALEGTWAFAHLEIDGGAMPPAAMECSRILIDGDRFRTESPEANYEGIFNINVETQPNEIDIEFVAGPEAGNWNYGIFRLSGDCLEICLDMHGKPRPREFRTSPNSGQAFETLRRTSHSRPENVAGGTPPAPPAKVEPQQCAGFDFTESPTLSRLQGEWNATQLLRGGQTFPQAMLATGLRATQRNEVNVSFCGELVIHALIRINEDVEPIEVDYYNLAGPARGTIQLGIMKWVDDAVCFSVAGPGQPRPTDFDGLAGDKPTVSQWRRKK
ncbi:hypothetical protein AYO40_06225 [Planctomycetaceae bacterium SCGC AG-212-D15]|nr:hypothetical protein AYO40_06225 [Planctomycetaceae bacterium SCGC AG-212-D15]